MTDPDQFVADHIVAARRHVAKFCARNHLEHLADEMESAALFTLALAARHDVHPAALSTYVYVAVRRAMLDVLRTRARHEQLTVEDLCDATGTRVVNGVDVAPVVARTAETRVLAGEVRAAVARLPERERRVIDLYYFRDATEEEIHTALGVCRTWAFRARHSAERRLRKAFGVRR